MPVSSRAREKVLEFLDFSPLLFREQFVFPQFSLSFNGAVASIKFEDSGFELCVLWHCSSSDGSDEEGYTLTVFNEKRNSFKLMEDVPVHMVVDEVLLYVKGDKVLSDKILDKVFY